MERFGAGATGASGRPRTSSPFRRPQLSSRRWPVHCSNADMLVIGAIVAAVEEVSMTGTNRRPLRSRHVQRRGQAAASCRRMSDGDGQWAPRVDVSAPDKSVAPISRHGTSAFEASRLFRMQHVNKPVRHGSKGGNAPSTDSRASFARFGRVFLTTRALAPPALRRKLHWPDRTAATALGSRHRGDGLTVRFAGKGHRLALLAPQGPHRNQSSSPAATVVSSFRRQPPAQTLGRHLMRRWCSDEA